MFLYFVSKMISLCGLEKLTEKAAEKHKDSSVKNTIVKDLLSPDKKAHKKTGTKAFFFTSLSGSLTLEAAMVLPIFLFAMVALLQYGKLMESAVKAGSSISANAEMMGAAAYLENEVGDLSKVPGLAKTVLTAAAAQTCVVSDVGDISAMKNMNMVQSSFLGKDEMIDLVLSYQVKSPVSMISLPDTFFVQRAKVRAWTGRTPDRSKSKEKKEEEEEQKKKVYVAETGSVYHNNRNCTYLKLSTKTISASELKSKRNNSGAKYYACELCGKKNPTGSVYVTSQGNRYHCSSGCSALKRTVSEMSIDEVGNRHACSKCG